VSPTEKIALNYFLRGFVAGAGITLFLIRMLTP